MRTYERRLAAIEQRSSDALVLVVVKDGETREDVIAREQATLPRGATLVVLSEDDARL